MRVLIAPDKFAGTMSARQAGEAIADGWLADRPGDEVRVLPVADGGPGTVEAVSAATGQKVLRVSTTDQRNRQVSAPWVPLDHETAVVEAASACGLQLVPVNERDPLSQDSYGVGTLIRKVTDEGFQRVIVGLGGTGTVDGGPGAAMALGAAIDAEFDVTSDRVLPYDYGKISSVGPLLDPPASIVAATDVRNPLLGKSGAARVFGPQKGASPEDVEILEASLHHVADVVENILEGGPWRDLPGAGAAGGLGFGLMVWLGASVQPGAALIADLLHLDEHVGWADFVITGEGSFDSQSLEGKAPMEVLERAGRLGRPTGIVAGRISAEIGGIAEELGEEGLREPVGTARQAGKRLASRVSPSWGLGS